MSAPEIRFAPLNDGSEEDCQCARCGSSCYFNECNECFGEGTVEEDFGNDACEDMRDVECGECEGCGGWQTCLSSTEWCEANPLPGREAIERGKIEWFSVPERPR